MANDLLAQRNSLIASEIAKLDPKVSAIVGPQSTASKWAELKRRAALLGAFRDTSTTPGWKARFVKALADQGAMIKELRGWAAFAADPKTNPVPEMSRPAPSASSARKHPRTSPVHAAIAAAAAAGSASSPAPVRPPPAPPAPARSIPLRKVAPAAAPSSAPKPAKPTTSAPAKAASPTEPPQNPAT